MRCARSVAWSSAGLERDEEDRAGRVGLEVLDVGRSLLGLAVDVLERNLVAIEALADEAEQRRELAKNENLVAFRQALTQDIKERGHLAALRVPEAIRETDEARVTGHLPQARDARQNMGLALLDAVFLDLAKNVLPHLREHRCVDLLLDLWHHALVIEDGFGRQILGDIFLHAAQDIGMHRLPQPGRSLVVTLADGPGVLLLEGSKRPEKARAHEVEEGPHVREAVRERRPGEREAPVAAQTLDPLGRLAVRVFDGLRLVGDDVGERLILEEFKVAEHDRITGDEHLCQSGLFGSLGPIWSVPQHRADDGGEFLDLVDPLLHENLGADDQHLDRRLFPRTREERDRL